MPPSLQTLSGFFADVAIDPLTASQTISKGVEKIVTEASFTLTNPGSITDATITIVGDNNSISAVDAEYQFSATMINPVPKGASLAITVPIDDIIPNGSTSGLSLTCSAGCDNNGATFSFVSSTLTISNLFLSYVLPGSDLTFSILGWTNPSSTETFSFEMKTIWTESATDYEIDHFTGMELSVVEGECNISLVNVTDGDNRIWVEPKNYTFIMTCNHDIIVDYGIKITLPE